MIHNGFIWYNMIYNGFIWYNMIYKTKNTTSYKMIYMDLPSYKMVIYMDYMDYMDYIYIWIIYIYGLYGLFMDYDDDISECSGLL